MVINLALWIIFGGVVGWLASVITGTNQQQGLFGNVVVGIVGAMLGGFLSNALGGPTVSGFNLTSVVVATVGAVILLLFLGMLRRGATKS